MTTAYDVIVLGLGIMGSATAYHLARAGQRVLALEQFEIDHRNGSSYGYSRVIRYAYEQAHYVELARAAYPLWRALEADTGQSLLHVTGGLDFGPAESASLRAVRAALQTSNIPFEQLTPAQVAERLPQFRLDDAMLGMYQADAGYLAASDCVRTLVTTALGHGAAIQSGTRVEEITVQGDGVLVRANGETFSAGRLVITAGSWAGRCLRQLDLDVPLQPTREKLVFFQPPEPDRFTPEHFPVFIAHGTTHYYGIPNIHDTGLKTAVHGIHEPTDSDHTNREVEAAYVAQVRGFLQRHIPTGDGPVRETRVCLYTMTPDEHFLIDRHPAHPQVVFGAGFSGHGFKFGILIGQILADLALNGTTPHNIQPFSVQRFL